MGPLFVILFGAIAAAIFAGTWLVCLAIFLSGRKKNKPVIKWISLIPLALLSLFAMTITCFFGRSILRSTIPKYVYEDAFNEKPSPDVHELKSRDFGFADSRDIYLQFIADSNTCSRIRPTEFQKVTFEDYKDTMSYNVEESPPRWWVKITTNVTIYTYRPEYGHGKEFASERYVMTYDDKTKVSQYYYLGID